MTDGMSMYVSLWNVWRSMTGERGKERDDGGFLISNNNLNKGNGMCEHGGRRETKENGQWRDGEGGEGWVGLGWESVSQSDWVSQVRCLNRIE